MKLYLSSYKLGDLKDKLVEMVGRGNKIAFIPNAMDFATDLERKQKSIQADVDSLTEIGLVPEIVDLNDYFDRKLELASKISEYNAVFVRGGNVFVLRTAMRKSGFDEILLKKNSDSNFVFAGYSAGPYVLGPSLKGGELVDDPSHVMRLYNEEPMWDGLGIINFAFEPHYKSDHPESEDVNKEIEYFIDNKILFRAFRDGEVYIQE